MEQAELQELWSTTKPYSSQLRRDFSGMENNYMQVLIKAHLTLEHASSQSALRSSGILSLIVFRLPYSLK